MIEKVEIINTALVKRLRKSASFKTEGIALKKSVYLIPSKLAIFAADSPKTKK